MQMECVAGAGSCSAIQPALVVYTRARAIAPPSARASHVAPLLRHTCTDYVDDTPNRRMPSPRLRHRCACAVRVDAGAPRVQVMLLVRQVPARAAGIYTVQRGSMRGRCIETAQLQSGRHVSTMDKMQGNQQMDLIALARESGMAVLLDARIGRQEYVSVSGSLAALARFADAVRAETDTDDKGQSR